MRKALRGVSMVAAVGTLAALGLAGAVPALAADVTGQTGSAFYGSGSDTTYNMMASLDQLYDSLPGCTTVNATAPPFYESAQCVDNANPTSANQVHDNSAERFPLNSGTGRRELCDQGLAGVVSVGYARSSSGISATSANDCVNETSVAYAQDAVTAFAFTADPSNGNATTGAALLPTTNSANPSFSVPGETPKNPTTQPTIKQSDLVAIYSATEDALGHAIKTAATATTPNIVYTWHDLGANDAAIAAAAVCPTPNADGTASGTTPDPVCQPIVVYSAPNGSGTTSTFSTGVLQSNNSFAKVIPSHIITENNALPIAANGQAANGLFYYSYGRYTANGLSSSVPADFTDGALLAVTTGTGATAVTNPVDEANIQAAGSVLPGYRKLYNVERYATPAVDRYVGFGGFICATGRDLTAGTGSTAIGAIDENNPVTQRIRQNGFVPFSRIANEGDTNSTPGYCRFGATIPDTQTPAAALSTVSAGATGVVLTFGGTAVLNANNSNITLTDATTGALVPTTVTCEDLQQRNIPSCSINAYDTPTGAVLVTPTSGFTPGHTYTVAANSSITDRGRQPLTPFTQSFPSPAAAPQTITVTVPVPGPTVTVPGPTVTVTKVTTVTVTTSVPTVVLGKATVSGTSVKVPVTCVDATCNGTLTLQSGKTKVTKTYRLSKGQTSTISASISRPKGAKVGKTSVSYKVAAVKGQNALGTKSGSVKI